MQDLASASNLTSRENAGGVLVVVARCLLVFLAGMHRTIREASVLCLSSAADGATYLIRFQPLPYGERDGLVREETTASWSVRRSGADPASRR